MTDFKADAKTEDKADIKTAPKSDGRHFAAFVAIPMLKWGVSRP